MNKDQKTVLRGILVGVVLLILTFLSVWVYSKAHPFHFEGRMLEDHIARCLLFSSLPLFALIGSVGNARFLSNAINPLRSNIDPRMNVLQRCLQNTLEQTVLLFAVIIGWAILVPAMPWVPMALTINFILGRLLFVLGYLKDPLYRATGMAMSGYPTFLSLIFLCVLQVIVTFFD